MLRLCVCVFFSLCRDSGTCVACTFIFVYIITHSMAHVLKLNKCMLVDPVASCTDWTVFSSLRCSVVGRTCRRQVH